MKKFRQKMYAFCLWALASIFMATMFCGSYAVAAAVDNADAQSIINKSNSALTDLMSDEAFYWLHGYLKSARGVLIFPQVLKAGFVFGGSNGTGVLLVRDRASGTWSEPAFYTVGSLTFGLQIGGETAEVVMVAMNQKALDSLLISTLKLGGDTSVAIGPIGGGAKGAVTIPEVAADFISFTKAKGLYAGLNLEGSALAVRDDLNQAYYGREVTPRDIIVRKAVASSGANKLRATLQKASAK